MEVTTQLHAPAVLPPIAIEQEAARVPEPVWTFGEEKNLLFLPGLDPRILQPIPPELSRL